MTKLATIMMLGMLAAGADAQTVYKCTANGKVSYSDQPCANGKVTALPPPPAGDAAAAQTMATRDAAALAAIEKTRAQALPELERAERDRLRAARAADTQRQKCERLRLKQQWAEEDAARADSKLRDAARAKAKRQGESLAVECPG